MNEQRLKENQERFIKIFPPRVKTLGKQIELLKNCANKANYVVDHDVARKVFIHLATMFRDMAREYDIEFHIQIVNDNEEEEVCGLTK